ncbi:MAG: phage resistance protein [Aerococcus sp.]|nr:phage resistance protein [Aerococcus sp.]
MNVEYRTASALYHELNYILVQLDNIDDWGTVDTMTLDNIKEIINSMIFCDISGSTQEQRHTGNGFYKEFSGADPERLPNIKVNYTIKAGALGLAYGRVSRKKKNEQEFITYNPIKFNNYARFLADLVAGRVIYDKGHFLIYLRHQYIPINDNNALLKYYSTDEHQRQRDFLKVMEIIYKNREDYKHPYIIHRHTMSGADFRIHAKPWGIETNITPKDNELFFLYDDISLTDLDLQKASDFTEMIAQPGASYENAMQVHAYVLARMMDLIHPEKFFIFKDFGRTGKGLFISTLGGFAKVHRINYHNLIEANGIEKSNEWAKLYDADVAHANEAKGIKSKGMNELRLISSGEVATGRFISKNTFSFKVKCVLIIDTNGPVDIEQITANKRRAVNIAFKDRPEEETEAEADKIFRPYIDWITDEETKKTASWSVLVNSVLYMQACHGRFNFQHAELPEYHDADQLTDTQIIMLEEIYARGFIEAGNETLQRAILADYGKLSAKKAQEATRAIGVATNQQKWINGKNTKIHKVANREKFLMAYKLLHDHPNNDNRSQTELKKNIESLTNLTPL